MCTNTASYHKWTSKITINIMHEYTFSIIKPYVAYCYCGVFKNQKIDISLVLILHCISNFIILSTVNCYLIWGYL